MAVQRLKEHIHLKLYSGCHHVFFHLSEIYGPKNISNTELINYLIENNSLEKYCREKELSAIKEFKKLSTEEQKEYLKLYIFTDKDYKI